MKKLGVVFQLCITMRGHIVQACKCFGVFVGAITNVVWRLLYFGRTDAAYDVRRRLSDNQVEHD